MVPTLITNGTFEVLLFYAATWINYLGIGVQGCTNLIS